MEGLKVKALEALEKHEFVLATQYLLDINNLLPKKHRINMTPPPRPEDYD